MKILPGLFTGFAAAGIFAFAPSAAAGGTSSLAGSQNPVSQDVVVRMYREKGKVSLDWLLDHESLFNATREEFEKQYSKKLFTWLDKEKTRARFNPDRNDITLRGEESGETIVSFKDGKVSGVMISVMNKGDDGYIKEGPFKSAIAKAKTTLAAVAKVAESLRKKNETISKAEGFVWSTKKAMYMLEYLWVPEERRDGYIWYAHGEFVRVRILPPQVLLGVQQNTLKTNISRPTLAKRVKREGTKVWLDGLPMVDQGSKGYCAVASFERVMRYYGSQVDMHDLADLANTSSFGTSPEGIKDAVHKMAVRSGLHTREPVFMQSKDFNSLISAYNREAKKASLGSVDRPQSILDLYQQMEPDLFRDMRAKDAGYNKFGSEVAKSINAGVPIMWALQLGMFWEDRLEDSYEANRENKAHKTTDGDADDKDKDKPEDADKDKDDADKDKDKDKDKDDADKDKDADADKDKDKDADADKDKDKDKDKEKPAKVETPEEEPPARAKRPPPGMAGGHMRIIIGYDPKEKLIFYTDSWGPGHEMKKMKLEEAWAVTMGLFIVEP